MGLGPYRSTSGLPHQPQWPSLKAVTAGTKARWFQQLVDAVGQATLKGQVPLHNAGVIFTHHELTLQVGRIWDTWGVTVVLQPSPFLFPLFKTSPPTHRPGTAAGKGDRGSMHGAEWAQVGQVRCQGLSRWSHGWS